MAERSAQVAVRINGTCVHRCHWLSIGGAILRPIFRPGPALAISFLWVVVWANLMAMLIQMLSAKLGIATGKNRVEQIRDHYPPRRYGCTGSGGNHCDGKPILPNSLVRQLVSS